MCACVYTHAHTHAHTTYYYYYYYYYIIYSGGVAGPAGPAKAGPLFSGSLIGLVFGLQRQSEDEAIGPGVPRKLAFALRVATRSVS